MDPIPLVDLRLQHAEVAAEIEAGLRRVMDSGAFILGDDVAEFEEAFARYCGVGHCVGVGSGTDALECALRAVDLEAGGEVILPANTFIATALAVVRAGGRPVLVDCDPEHYLIDAQQVSEAVSQRTRCILPVHLYGQIAPVENLEEVAARHGLPIIEDAAQAHGARRHGRGIGDFGVAAGVSFYPGKNLGAYGDGGAVLTNSESVARRVRHLRNWGSEVKYSHPEFGFNSRLDTIQAVVLSAKLKRLTDWNRWRHQAAARYDELLAGVPNVRRPGSLPGNEHVWHLYVVRVPRRDEVLAALQAAGIGAGVHYPVPVHLHGAMRSLGYRAGRFPVAEQAAAEILSLPLFPGITREQQERVVETLARSLA